MAPSITYKFVLGAARRAWLAWRERRLDLSPATLITHLRNYHRELRVRGHVESSGRSEPIPFEPVVASGPDDRSFLVISDFLPTPDRDSGSVRMSHILRFLGEIGHEVSFVSDSETRIPEAAEALSDQGIPVIYGFEAASNHLLQWGHRYRFVLLSRPEVAFRYLFLVRACAIHATVVYDTVDLHWLRMTRAAALTSDLELHTQADHMDRLEAFSITSADMVLAVTRLERDAIRQRHPDVRVEVITNVHGAATCATPWDQRHGLMFIGSFRHAPNEDAIRFLASDILPRIRQELPDVELAVVGSYVTESMSMLAADGVRIVGHVADPTPYFERSRVFVAPLRYGAGMKGKIGQSMSYGLPVVTTSMGAEGMALVTGEHALIADTPEEFATAVVRLYRDGELWQRISGASRAHVSAHFSERVVSSHVRQLFPVATATPQLEIATT